MIVREAACWLTSVNSANLAQNVRKTNLFITTAIKGDISWNGFTLQYNITDCYS